MKISENFSTLTNSTPGTSAC